MTLRAELRPLQLPCGEAPNMQMELIQPGHRALSPDELNLEFQLVLRDGPRAHCAGLPRARPAPHAIRVAERHAGGSRLFSEERLVVVGHLVDLQLPGAVGASGQNVGGPSPSENAGAYHKAQAMKRAGLGEGN